MICYACNMSDVGETKVAKAYRLKVCRRCRMFEDKRNPPEVKRLPVETKTAGDAKQGRPPLAEMEACLARQERNTVNAPAAKPAKSKEA